MFSNYYDYHLLLVPIFISFARHKKEAAIILADKHENISANRIGRDDKSNKK